MSKFNSFLYIGSMESISLEMGDYGEGLQFIYKSNNFIVIQQSFGIGRNLIISRLYLDFENESTIKLIKYTEEHINRFDIDKDFNDITSDFVYDLHKSRPINYAFSPCLQKAFKKGRWSAQKRTSSVLKGTA